MTNAQLSSKARARRDTAPVTSPQQPRRLVAEHKRSRAEELRAGSDLLVKATEEFAASSAGNLSKAGNTPFREAYLALTHSLPKTRRMALLETMRRSIDEVIQGEQSAALAKPAAARSQSVDTAEFMAELGRQEAVQRSRDISMGRLLPGVTMRERLHVSPQALSSALKKKRMFALVGPSGEYLYPSFFAEPKLDRKILERVCQALGDLPGASKWDFFTTPRYSLGGKTALTALEKGKVEAVMDAANAFREE